MAEWNAEREAAAEKRLASARRERMVASLDTVYLIAKDLPDLLAHSKRQAEVIRGLVVALERVEHQYGSAQTMIGFARCASCRGRRGEHTSRCPVANALAAARELREGE